MHRPPHQRGHCDGSPCYSRKQQPTDEADDWEYQDTCVMQLGYSKTHNRDIPIHILQMPLSDNFHQMVCCVLPAEVLLFYL